MLYYLLPVFRIPFQVSRMFEKFIKIHLFQKDKPSCGPYERTGVIKEIIFVQDIVDNIFVKYFQTSLFRYRWLEGSK